MARILEWVAKDRGTWWVTAHGVARSPTGLRDEHTHTHTHMVAF